MSKKQNINPIKHIYAILTFWVNYPLLLIKLNTWVRRYISEDLSNQDLKKLREQLLQEKLTKKELKQRIENIEEQFLYRKLNIWNHFLEETLPKKYLSSNFILSKSPDLTCIIAETREHPHFKVIVENTISNTQHLNIGLQVYHGTDNEEFVRNSLKNYQNIEFINLNVSKIDIEGYNQILLSKNFHERIPTDKFLVFQTDAVTFKPLDKKFLEYDYIGAPWKKELHEEYKAEVGNGGLSIRSKAAMLKIISQNIPRIKNQPEDLYLAQILKKQNFNVAPYDIALEFATEDVFNMQTFGCHKSWELIKFIELKQLLSQLT